MSYFDDAYDAIESYRRSALSDTDNVINDMTSAVSNWYNITFPKEGAPLPQLSFNKDSQSLQLDAPDYSPVDSDISLLSSDASAFSNRFSAVAIPNIVVQFDKSTDLTGYELAKQAANYDPTTAFETITLDSLSSLTADFCSMLQSAKIGFNGVIDYYIEAYATGIAVLDSMYQTLTMANRTNFNIDVARIDNQENSQFDYKTRSAVLDTYDNLSNLELNFVSNMASLYLKIVKTLLDRNAKEAALWKEEKGLLVRYEWDKYTTTVKGFADEFGLLLDSATTKIKNDIKAITSNYLIELGKFETNLKASEATADMEKYSGAAEIEAYQMKLLKLDATYKSALQTARGEYKSLMDTTVAAFSSIASELQTAVPTGISLLTTKN